MASPIVLTFDAEGRAVDFEVWVDDLQLFLQCESKDGVSLFDHTSGVSPAPAATTESTVCLQWTTCDDVARLAVRIARYSSPATAALSHFMLPYLFPDLAAFATIADLITHLRTSDARYRAAIPTEFCAKNPSPMYITLYYLVTRLPDSLASDRDHFLSLCPTELTVDQLEERLTAAEKSIVAVVGGAATARARGARVVEGTVGAVVEAVEEAVGVAVEVGVVAGVGASVAAMGVVEAAAAAVEAAAAAAVVEVAAAVVLVELEPRSVEALVWYAGRGRSGGVGPCTYVLCTGRRRGETCGLPYTAQRCFGCLTDAWRAQFPDTVELPRWGDFLKQNVAIFDLDFDDILAAMYAVSDSAEGGCYLCVPPNPGIEAAALGTSESAAPGTSESVAPGAGESALSGTAPTEALHTFTLDSGASRSFFRDRTTLTSLSRPVAVSLADPSGGPVLAHSSMVLPCPAAPSGLLSGLHLPLFSTNLVSGADLQDLWVDQFTPGGQRVTHCNCSRTGRHLATFTRRPGSNLYTLTTASPPVTASSQVAASGQVFADVSRSLPPLPPGPAPTCVPCLEGRQRTAHHSSEFLSTEAPLQTLNMDVWGPARVSGQGHERYFLLVVDDYSRYTTVFPLRHKGEVIEVLIDWICEARRQLSESFGSDLPVLRLHSDRGGEFSSDLPRAFCRAEGSARRSRFRPPHNKMGLLSAALAWSWTSLYAAHQINLQPRVSLPETTPTLRWTGKVGDASVFRVWGSRAFVRDTSTDKLSSRAVPCFFLGFPPDAPGWQFYHLTSRRVLSSQDVTFDESGPAPSGVSQVDTVEPVEVAVDSSAARGAEPAGAGPRGAEPGVGEFEGAEPGGVEPERVEPGGAEPGGAESRGAEPGGAEPERAESGGPPGVPSRREPLSPQRVREWYARRCSRAAGATGPATGGASGAGAAGGAAGAGAARAAGPGGAGAGGTGAVGGSTGVGAAGGAGAAGPGGAGTGGTGAARAGGAAEVGAVGAGAVATRGAAGAGAAGGTGAGGAAGVVAGDPGAEGIGAVSALQPASPLPGPSPYSGPTRGLTERREPESHPASPKSRPASPESRPELSVCAVCTGRRVPRQRPPPIPGTHSMNLRPSTAPQRVPLPSPPASSLPDGSDPVSDSLCAASPTVTRFPATAVIDPLFESIVASALLAELVYFAAAFRLDYATSLVAESEIASVCPPSVEGECALGTDVLEDRQEEFECFVVALPHLVSMLLAPEGDPDALDIPTPRSYAEAIEGPYSSQWQTAMDTEMASWKSIGTYVDEVPPPGANIVSGMWIFRTFSPTPKITTFRVLLHVAAHRDYELHSLDFSRAFLQGSLHEEIWLRRPPGFTRLFPAGTQWSLRRPVYGLRQAPREWHDTLGTTLAALGLAPSTADPSLFLRTDTALPPFYVLVYVYDLVLATADIEALAHVKSELQKRHTCTDLGPSALRLHVLLTTVHSSAYRSLALSSTFGRVLRRAWGSCLEDELELSSLVTQTLPGLTTWLRSGRRSSQGYTFSLGSGSVSRSSSLTFLLTDLGEAPRSPPVLYVDNKAMLALCQEHRTKHIALRYFLARELQQRGQLRLAYVATQANTPEIFTKALQPCDHQRFCTMLGLVPTWPHLLTS
ncbi:unnamed protein product [Closterium sp. NIES-53]